MQIHSCGNPLHDVPQWILAALPFLAPLIIYGRALYGRARARFTRS